MAPHYRSLVGRGGKISAHLSGSCRQWKKLRHRTTGHSPGFYRLSRERPADFTGRFGRFDEPGHPVAGHIQGFEIVADYPELKHLPIVIGESDPEGCAACSVGDYPANAYRNGTLYSSYTAAAFARKFDLADHFGINFRGRRHLAFEFEDQPWFNGYRDLATNGVDKPVLNIFRMYGMMSGERVEVSGDLAYDFRSVRDSSVRGEEPDINALAATEDNKATVMVWNYHDLNVEKAPVPVCLEIDGIGAERARLEHYRVDRFHSNSYERWLEMGSPQEVSDEQYAALEKAGKLHLIGDPVDEDVVEAALPYRWKWRARPCRYL